MIEDIGLVDETAARADGGEQFSPERLRIWSAITVPLLAIIVATIVSGIALVSAIVAQGIPLDPANATEATTTILSQPIGLWVALVPGQAVFLTAALVAAFMSPVKTRQRLQILPSSMPVWTWFVFAVATPAVGILMSMFVEFSGIELSEQLESINQMMGGKSGMQLVIAAVLVGVVPGIAEELLFRGYLQSRLAKRWSAAAAILVSAAIFAIAHLDPMHVLLVFPIGIWLGVVAWRTGSVWPAVLCHMANNLLAVVLAQSGTDSAPSGTSEYILLVPCGLAMIASVYLMRRTTT